MEKVTHMKFLYNGMDIISSSKPSKMFVNDYAGGEADELIATFPNVKLWAEWKPKTGDTVQLIDGSFDSGILYIYNPQIQNNICRLEAISVPNSARKPRTKIWRDIQLSGIISDCASRAGLSFQTYGIVDYTYTAISQNSESDFAFLKRICTREGYAVKVSNNTLIVFSEKYMENQPSGMTINKKEVAPNYSFKNGLNLLSRVRVCHYNVTKKQNIDQTAKDTSIIGGEMKVNELCSDSGEALRFAYGYLRNVNKNRKIGYIQLLQQAELAAGSVITLDGFDGENNGNWFVYRVGQDAVNSRTELFLRRPLNY